MVRKMRREGRPNSEIARKVGLSYYALARFLAMGKFGNDLPSRKGQRTVTRQSRQPDCEKTGRIFGTTDWQDRQKEIKNGWSDEEADARRKGKLPNRTDNYSLFKK